MNKTELINEIWDRGDSKVGVESVLNHLLDIILEETAAGHEVNIKGFGKFGSREVKERTFTTTIEDMSSSTTVPKHRKRTFIFSDKIKKIKETI